MNELSGEILETQGQYAKPLPMSTRQAIAKNPRALNLHFQLARALMNSSHEPETLDQALKEIDAELALNPSDAVAVYQAARILQVRERGAEAATRATRRRSQIAPRLLWKRYAPSGLCATRSGAAPRPFLLLEKAVQLAPSRAKLATTR